MAGTNVQITNVPPVPSAETLTRKGDFMSQAFQQWLQVLRTKINAINGFIVSLAGITTPGIVVTNGSGQAYARTLTSTADTLTITNGNGVAGNPNLDLTPIPGVAGSYTNMNATVNGYGQITAATNGTGGSSITDLATVWMFAS